MIAILNSRTDYYKLLTELQNRQNPIATDYKGRIDAGCFNHTKLKGVALHCSNYRISKAFTEWDKNNINTRFKKKVAYFTLSFAPRDIINVKLLVIIAKEFLKGMGYENLPYLIFRHDNNPFTCINIVTSRVGLDRKKVKADFEVYKAIKLCRVLEGIYQLTKLKTKEAPASTLNLHTESFLK